MSYEHVEEAKIQLAALNARYEELSLLEFFSELVRVITTAGHLPPGSGFCDSVEWATFVCKHKQRIEDACVARRDWEILEGKRIPKWLMS